MTNLVLTTSKGCIKLISTSPRQKVSKRRKQNERKKGSGRGVRDKEQPQNPNCKVQLGITQQWAELVKLHIFMVMDPTLHTGFLDIAPPVSNISLSITSTKSTMLYSYIVHSIPADPPDTI